MSYGSAAAAATIEYNATSPVPLSLIGVPEMNPVCSRLVAFFVGCHGVNYFMGPMKLAKSPAVMPKSLFNGTDLTDWSGDPRLWAVRDGIIHGETTADNAAMGNTFLIWQGGQGQRFRTVADVSL